MQRIKDKEMDAKITKQRLGRLLSYDWIKIIALAVAAIVVWSLIFTMTATRITAAQQFSVFNYFKMQVCAKRVAGVAHLGNVFALCYLLPLFHVQFTAMRIARLVAVAVVN